MKRLTGMGLLVAAVMVTGCGTKKVDLTVTNQTSDALRVALVEQGVSGVPFMVPAGGRVRQRIEEQKEFLPVTYVLKAGELEQPFTIDEDTPSKLALHILPTQIIGPLKPGDTADVKYEHDISGKVGQGTKVE